LLDTDDDTHMWCLHDIYLAMLNKHLQTWRDAWVHHPLRTEGNKTPMQLWIGGLHFTHFGQTVMHSAHLVPVTEEEFRQYGIDWNGPVSTGDDNIVEVPDTLCPFSDHILSQLRQSVNPSSDDGNYGISLYVNAVSEVTRLLQFQNLKQTEIPG